jgi:hypothetical protein
LQESGVSDVVLQESWGADDPAERAEATGDALQEVEALFPVPLLEDRLTVQMMLSDVLRLMVERRISAPEARAMAYALQVAAQNLTQMARERNMDKPAEGRVGPEPVEEFEQAADGEDLGPETEYVNPWGKRTRVWSYDKMLYNRSLKEQGLPEILYEEDFPEEGYLNDEEMRARQKKHAEILGPGRAHLLGPMED